MSFDSRLSSTSSDSAQAAATATATATTTTTDNSMQAAYAHAEARAPVVSSSTNGESSGGMVMMRMMMPSSTATGSSDVAVVNISNNNNNNPEVEQLDERDLEEQRILERERMMEEVEGEGTSGSDDEVDDFEEEVREEEEEEDDDDDEILYEAEDEAVAAMAQAADVVAAGPSEALHLQLAQVLAQAAQAREETAAAAAEEAPLQSPDDPRRMDLTKEEREWAWNIKEAIEADPEIDNLHDFVYAQLAIIEQGNVQGAVDRAAAMQGYREEYKIMDTHSDAMKYLASLLDLAPGVYISFSFNQRDGNYVLVFDLAKFDMQCLSTMEGVACWLGGGYYMFTANNPDFESIRRGNTMLVETEGFDWNKNMSFKAFRKVWSELGSNYPCKFQQIKYFHTGMFINLIYSMCRKVLPSRVHSKFQVGCQFDKRLDAIYVVPTLERSNQRIMARWDEALRRRYENEKTFTLGSRHAEEDAVPNETLSTDGAAATAAAAAVEN